jgi:hypothetical protein
MNNLSLESERNLIPERSLCALFRAFRDGATLTLIASRLIRRFVWYSHESLCRKNASRLHLGKSNSAFSKPALRRAHGSQEGIKIPLTRT